MTGSHKNDGIPRSIGRSFLISLFILIFLGVFVFNAYAANKTWNFSSAADYVKDAAKVLIDGTSARLKNFINAASHQNSTDFNGAGSNYEAASYQTDKITLNESSYTRMDPIALWNFDETSGNVAFDTAGGHDVQLTGFSGSAFSAGQSGFQNAVVFDGSSKYGTSTPIDLATTPAVTLSFWLKWDAFANDGKVALEFSSDALAGTTGFIVIPNSPGGKFEIALKGNIGDAAVEFDRPSAGAWHHYAMVLDKVKSSNEIDQVYIDGSVPSNFVTTFNSNNTNNFGTHPLYFMTHGGTSNFGTGSLDEVMVFNRPLQLGELNLLRTATKSLILERALPAENTSAHWGLDDGTGTTATGTFSGSLLPGGSGPTWSKTRAAGNFALKFDGTDDYVSVSNAGALNPIGKTFSVSAWIKTPTPPGSLRGILSKGVAATNGYVLGLDASGFPYYKKDKSSVMTLTGNKSVSDNRWHLITGTAGPTGMALYIDGTFSNSNSNVDDFVTSTASFMIGKSPSGFFKGFIDEVSVYQRVLGPEEILQMYMDDGRYQSPDIDSAVASVQWGTLKSTKGFPFGEALAKPPVSYWNLDGNANDQSLLNHGTLGGGAAAPVWSQDLIPEVGFTNTHSLYFDGVNDYVQIANDASLNPLPMTISLWFKKAVGADGTILDKRSGNTGYALYVSSGSLYGSYGNGASAVIVNGGPVNDGQWHHAVLRVSSSEIRIFLDSISKDSMTETFTISTSNLYLGQTTGGAGFFRGFIDEVAIYDRLLNDSEINRLGLGLKHSHKMLGIYEKDLVGLWHLDNDVLDYGKANHGTFNGGTLAKFGAGVEGPAILFDGTDDFINVSHAANIDASSQFWTVSAWIKSKMNDRAILSKGTSGANGYEIGIDSVGNLQFKKNGVSLSSFRKINDDAWHLVLGTADSSGMRIYIDGLLDNSNLDFANFIGNSNALTIGKSSNGSSNFGGYIDEVAIFNNSLTSAQVMEIYKRGTARTQFQLRTSTTTNFSSSSWHGGGTPHKGANAIWHFNEYAGGNTPDAMSNIPSTSGTAALTQGKISNAFIFNGSSNSISASDHALLNPPANLWSISAWVKTSSVSGSVRTIVSKGSGSTGYELSLNASSFAEFKKKGTTGTATGSRPLNDDSWHHIVGTAGSSAMYLYVDGILEGQNLSGGAGANFMADSGVFYIGQSSSGNFFEGAIDDVAIYGRTLSGREAWDLFQAGTYVNTVQDGGFLHGAMKNQFMQYRALFQSYDSSIAPDLKTVKVSALGPYPADNPTIEMANSDAFNTLSNFSINAAGISDPNAQIRFVLSKDGGTNWFYLVGSTWTSTSGTNYAESSLASDINPNIGSFDDSLTGNGSLKWKAFMHSNGSVAPELFSVTSDPTLVKTLNITAPVANQNLAVTQSHPITWTATNITNVKIMLINNAGNPLRTLSANEPVGTSNFTVTPLVGEAQANAKIRIEDASDATVSQEIVVDLTKVDVTNFGASRYLAGAAYTIAWTHTGLSNVKLESTVDGSNYSTIIGSTPASAGSYGSFTVPVATSSNFKIRISDADTPTNPALDVSDSAAAIYGQLAFTSMPTSWVMGQAQNITWTTTPANANVIPAVKIVLAKNGNFGDSASGNLVTLLDANTNPSTVSWTPNFLSTISTKIQILDKNAASPEEGKDMLTSPNITIAGLTIDSPAGGGTSVVGGNMLFTFNFAGVTKADFDYAYDGGTNWVAIPTSDIEYDSGGGTWVDVANNSISGSPKTLRWNPIPNTVNIISTNVKIRMKGLNNADQLIYSAISNAFNIKGSLNSPAAPGSPLRAGETHVITWSTLAGIIDNVKLEFVADGTFNGDEVLIVASTANNGSFGPWTVPGTVVNPAAAKFKVTDVTTRANGTPFTSAESAAFAIHPKFNFTAPIGEPMTEWGVGSSPNVTWTTAGTTGNIKIEFLSELDSNYTVPGTPIANNIANTGSQAWNAIPNLVTYKTNLSTVTGQDPQVDRDVLIKIRITDLVTNAFSESAPFKVKWYEIKWKIKDVDTSALLSNLSVCENSGCTNWNVSNNSLQQGAGWIARNYMYGTYSTTWSKDPSTNYQNKTINPWAADSDKEMVVFMQNGETATVPTEVRAEYRYVKAANTFTFNWWLEVKGVQLTNTALLGTGRIEIIENGATTVLETINDSNGADVNGLFSVVNWSNLNGANNRLDINKIYFAKAIITYNGTEKQSGITINVRPEPDLTPVLSNLSSVQATAAALDTKLGALSDTESANSLFGKLDVLKKTLGEVDDTSSDDTVFGELSADDADMTTILESVETEIPNLIKQNSGGSKGGRGRLLQRNPKAALGSITDIRFQHDTGLFPKVDIYDPLNNVVISQASMKEIGTTGIYNYTFKVLNTLPKGEYTVLVKEPSTSFMDSMVLQVISAAAADEKISASIASASSSAQNASSDAKKVFDEVSGLKAMLGGTEQGGISSQLSEIATMMTRVRKSINIMTGDNTGEGEVTIGSVHDAILGVMDEVKNVAGRQGVNLDAVYKGVSSQEKTTQDIQNMVAATQIAALTTQEILEKAQEQPVMKTWFEAKG